MCLSADYSVVIKLNIGTENTPLSYPHSFSLQSPTFAAPHTDMCLTLEYTSLVQFSVKLVCLRDGNDEAVEDVLRWSWLDQGFELHCIHLAVPAKFVDYDTCLLSFHILSGKSGMLAAINSVTLTEGTCVHPGGLFIYFPLNVAGIFMLDYMAMFVK